MGGVFFKAQTKSQSYDWDAANSHKYELIAKGSKCNQMTEITLEF